MVSSSAKSEILGEGETEPFVDRFSSLPDKIAHHILDFLDVVDLSQLMLVSKRWKTKKRKRERVKKKVDHNKELFYRVHEYFMKTVSCCDTESLHLGLMSPELKPQWLHPLFFDITNNLKELTVRTNNCSLGFFEISFETFPKLEKLTLLFSKLKDSEISWVVFHLPSLKALCLHCCTGLKKLILRSKPAFGIVSSQLKEFVWHGLPLGYYFADRSVHLQNAETHLLLPTKRLQWELSDASTGLLDDVIDQLKMTKTVTFHANTIRICIFHMNDCLSSPLSKVENLAIAYCTLADTLVPPIAFFLQGMLDLKSLSITSRVPRKQVEEVVESFGPSMEGLKGFNMEYWEAQGLKFVPQLQKATIEVWNRASWSR
ncbi:hypothetical protein SLEP1_g30909 [Rubroshorea leprosula]|uniref:F-box domain-containing protein n=1 Tax=Rubroshorea leprosula TaxID=152421 RepID=A0AAV5K719_9ROSI|nr:hypothetical protein SLEP1_g30909 [Rubroshorea leprosula]